MTRQRLTVAEKFERKADKIDRKAVEKYPLLAPLFHRVTREEVYWHWRFNVARAFDHLSKVRGVWLLDTLTTARWRELARSALGAEMFERLHAYQLLIYPPDAPGYEADFWRQVLSGRKRVVYALDGVEDGVFPLDGWTPPFTWGQLLEMFPVDRWERQDKPMEFGAGGGLWARVSADLAMNRSTTIEE